MRLARFMVCLLWAPGLAVEADVRSAGEHGFSVEIERETQAPVRVVDRAVVKEIHRWWDPAHSYSGDAKNLSIDLERRRLNEALANDGFVTHMQIAHYQPGEQIRMLGGLGPLQEMGVFGALTIRWDATDGGSKIKLTYNVTGYLPDGQLQALAPVVDGVLAGQLDRLAAYASQAVPGS